MTSCAMRFPIWRPFWSFLYKNNINRALRNRILFYSISNQANLLKMDPDVVHDEGNNEFYINLGKDKAVLQYQFLGEEIMDMYHTDVPQSQRGKGLASHLVKAALSFVVEKNLKVRPTCSYVQHYINKNKPQDIVQRIAQE